MGDSVANFILIGAEMNRKMCDECPFKDNSNYNHYKDEWGQAAYEGIKEGGFPLDGSYVHFCHKLGDGLTCNDEEKCVGQFLDLKMRGENGNN